MAITTTEQTEIMKTVSALFNKTFTPETSTKFFNFYEANGKSLSALADGLIGSAAYEALYNGAGTVSEFGKILMAKYGMTYGGTSDADTKMTAFVDYSFANAADNNSVRTIQAVDKFIVATLLPSITTGNVFETMNTAIENKATVATAFKNNAENAGKEMSLSSVTSDAATVTAATAGAIASNGTTFTLTKDVIDNITGTNGNDIFIGDANTSTADSIIGGAGTDTLKLYGNAASPIYSGVETVYLNANTAGFDVSTHSDVTKLQLDGVAHAQTYTIANGQATSIANQGTQTIDFAGNTVTALSLDLNAAGSTTAGTTTTIDFNSTAQTALTLNTMTAASNIAIANTAAKIATLTVTGDKAISIDADTNTTVLTTVNAAAATGDVSITLEDDTTTKDVTVTTGTGNDTANFGAAFTKADKFDGGTGTDTLAITQASLTAVNAYATEDKATVNANLANIEVLKINDALTSDIDASRFDSVNSFVLAAGINNGGTSTISSVTSGVTVTINDAAGTNTDILAINVTDATVAGKNSDIVNIALNDAAAVGSSDMGVLNLVGIDTLNISTASTVAATGVAGTTTGYVLDIANTSTALDNVVVTGSIALDISTVALTNSLASITAEGMTLTAVTSNGLTAAIATGGTNGVFMTGSMGIDVLTGGDAADIISAGTGVDTITGGKGVDTVTGGAGNDIFAIAAADTGITAATADVITDYSNTTSTTASDKIDFTTSNGVVATTALAGFTLSAGVAAKANATVTDFIAAVQAAGTANETYAFVSGSDTYVYNSGANGTTNTTDDSLVKLTGIAISSVVTTDTVAANELFIS